jgi:hypothetical protein
MGYPRDHSHQESNTVRLSGPYVFSVGTLVILDETPQDRLEHKKCVGDSVRKKAQVASLLILMSHLAHQQRKAMIA